MPGSTNWKFSLYDCAPVCSSASFQSVTSKGFDYLCFICQLNNEKAGIIISTTGSNREIAKTQIGADRMIK